MVQDIERTPCKPSFDAAGATRSSICGLDFQKCLDKFSRHLKQLGPIFFPES